MIIRYFIRVHKLKKRGWLINGFNEWLHPFGRYVVRKWSLFKMDRHRFEVLLND